MKAIFKYNVCTLADVLAGKGVFTTSIPNGAEVIKVEQQVGHYINLWAIVDVEMKTEKAGSSNSFQIDYSYPQAIGDMVERNIVFVATGQAVADEIANADYLGTIMISEGEFVYHVFMI